MASKPKKTSPEAVEEKKAKQEKRNLELDVTLHEIRKRFGEGAIMHLDEKHVEDVRIIPTGSISLDLALGVGGIPRGRVTEIYGPESSGKTTLALHIVAEAQKLGGVAAFVDAEHALDPDYAKKIGIKEEEFLISQPDTGEQALDIVEALVRSGNVDVIVIDSVAALTPRAEIEGTMEDVHMGRQARLMSQALRKLTAIVAKSNTSVIFINQIRMKIGVVFGNPETTPGGNALKFYSSVRLDIRRAAQIKQGEEIIGNRTRVKVVKNKVAAPFKIAEFDILYNEGISKESDVLNTGLKYDVLERKGAWFAYQGEQLGQGMDASRIYLKENPKILKSIVEGIEKAVKEA